MKVRIKDRDGGLWPPLSTHVVRLKRESGERAAGDFARASAMYHLTEHHTLDELAALGILPHRPSRRTAA